MFLDQGDGDGWGGEKRKSVPVEMSMSSLPPLRAVVKGAVWCGGIWAIGYGSYILTLGQMDKNLKTVRAIFPKPILFLIF